MLERSALGLRLPSSVFQQPGKKRVYLPSGRVARVCCRVVT